MIDAILELKAGASGAWTIQVVSSDNWVQKTGTVTLTQGSNIITGSSTLFTTEFVANVPFMIDGFEYEVQSISTNTLMYAKTPARSAGSGLLIFLADVTNLTGDTIFFAIKKESDVNVLNASESSSTYYLFKKDITSHTSATFGITTLSILNTESVNFPPGDYRWEFKLKSLEQVTDTGVFRVPSRAINQRNA